MGSGAWGESDLEMTDMTSGHFRLQEECGCHAAFKLALYSPDQLSMAMAFEQARLWRNEHNCQTNRRQTVESTGETRDTYNGNNWQQKFVGQPCTVCDKTLEDARNLTTRSGNPVHVNCLFCYICKKRAASIANTEWFEEIGAVDGPLPMRLVHKKCLKDVKELPDATDTPTTE